MKLTIEKPKLGYTHVRGGRVLSVIHGHEVSAKTLNTIDPDRRQLKREVVSCKPGDLVVEIVLIKTGKVIGYAYISGDAIQLMRYGMQSGLRPDLFEPVIGWRVSLQPDDEIDPMKMIHAIQRCKYAPEGVRAVVFKLVIDEGNIDDAKGASEFIFKALGLEPLPGSPMALELGADPVQRSHVFRDHRGGGWPRHRNRNQSAARRGAPKPVRAIPSPPAAVEPVSRRSRHPQGARMSIGEFTPQVTQVAQNWIAQSQAGDPTDGHIAADILADGVILRDATIAELTSERDAYRAMVCDLVASASPHPVEHPTMSKQWGRARELLKNSPSSSLPEDLRAALTEACEIANEWIELGIPDDDAKNARYRIGTLNATATGKTCTCTDSTDSRCEVHP